MANTRTITESDVTITVTQLDYLRLTKLIQTLRENNSVEKVYLQFLDIELQKAIKTDSKLIMPDFVTMNSVMSVVFLDSGRSMKLRLVYPQKANFSEGLISVLSPLGCALLGYKAGDTVTFMAPIGEQKVMINEVLYQPEANGEDL
ncbi:MAG: GreA/GreB family elongation factor [Bacteroidetes bacterium]|nr:GreA/GreB family elongation factor [Bacteroidota bacterium]